MAREDEHEPLPPWREFRSQRDHEDDVVYQFAKLEDGLRQTRERDHWLVNHLTGVLGQTELLRRDLIGDGTALRHGVLNQILDQQRLLSDEQKRTPEIINKALKEFARGVRCERMVRCEKVVLGPDRCEHRRRDRYAGIHSRVPSRRTLGAPGYVAGCIASRYHARVTVCGALMCKDEEVVIERCLRSMAPFVDRFLILDTGSTDNTLAIVKKTLGDLRLPFRIMHRPFDTYAQSRTYLVKHVIQSENWVLMIDADCTLSGERPSLPDAEIGLVEFICDGVVSQRAVYLANHVDWRYESGMTLDGRDLHEAVTADTPHRASRVRGVVMEHHGEAGDNRSSEDDLAILQELAARFPTNPRWTFYVAQTLKGMGRRAEAIATYRECAIMGRLGDEWVWYCMFQSAVLDQDAHALLVASLMRPQRAEGWYALACLLSNAARYDLALPAATRAAGLPEPPDSLFINRSVYRWAARLELSVCLGGVGMFEAALHECTTLLAVDSLPEVVRREVMSNAEQFRVQLHQVPVAP